jgi:hypothetical protein
VIEQGEEIVRMIVDAIRCRRRIGEAVPALVVGHDAETIGEVRNNILPDAEIAAERVVEDECRRVRTPDDLVMQNDAVCPNECHVHLQCNEPTPI